MASIGSFEGAARRADPDREADWFELCGERFYIADVVSPVPMMRFAKMASGGMDSDDMQGLVAMYDVIRDCLAEEEREPDVLDEAGNVVRPGKVIRPGFDHFCDVASRNKVDGDTLLTIVGRVHEVVTARPTRPPSGSSDGQSTSSGGSTVTSSQPARPPAFRHDPQFDDMVTAEELLAWQRV